MGVLEQVTELKEKGVSEDGIVKKLREQGISPNEISEALSHAKIKDAVSSEESGGGKGKQEEKMTPSIMGSESLEEIGARSLPTENISDENLTPPKPSGSKNSEQEPGRGFRSMTKEVSEENRGNDQNQGTYTPQPHKSPQYPMYQEQEQYSPPYQDYQGSDYPQYQDYGDQNYYDQDSSDNIIEIAEQVFSEKIKDIQKQVNEFSEFRTLAEEKIKNISDRLKRMESNIDRLQAEILEKVGSYGRGLESIKKEMGMMQDSFGKVVNTLVDKAEEKHHQRSSTHPTQKTRHPPHNTKKKSVYKSKSRK